MQRFFKDCWRLREKVKQHEAILSTDNQNILWSPCDFDQADKSCFKAGPGFYMPSGFVWFNVTALVLSHINIYTLCKSETLFWATCQIWKCDRALSTSVDPSFRGHTFLFLLLRQHFADRSHLLDGLMNWWKNHIKEMLIHSCFSAKLMFIVLTFIKCYSSI